MPLPTQVWLCSAAHHDSKAFKEQQISLSDTTLFGDMAFADQELSGFLALQQTNLLTPKKKPKGKELTEMEKYRN